MSKERLEEIEVRLKYGLGCLKNLRRKILNSNDESLKDQINLLENDIKYLFEQAERVQELEVWRNEVTQNVVARNAEYAKCREQNKRYHEAIERAISILENIPSYKGTPKKHAIEVLSESLKGDKQ